VVAVEGGSAASDPWESFRFVNQCYSAPWLAVFVNRVVLSGSSFV
jgi:hypothetical protein